MSMVFPGITHCEYCGERIDVNTGRRCNCLDGKRTIQENKPKLKLIDILNKIANGELKEGTKFVYRGNMYIWEDNMILNTTNTDAFDIVDRSDLNMELELIEPQEPTDNTTEKIEEVSAWGRTTFEYGSPVPADWVVANKIN